MRTITKEYKIYKFDELSEDSKNRAVSDYIDFMLDTTDFEKLNKNTNLYKAVRKAEEMQTVWFTKDYVWEYCEKEILKNVKKFEYYENGVYYN